VPTINQLKGYGTYRSPFLVLELILGFNFEIVFYTHKCSFIQYVHIV
jgi:hypothetical protein